MTQRQSLQDAMQPVEHKSTSPGQGNASNKNGPARVKQRMQWEAPSKSLAVDDPLLLPEREVHAKIGINWDLLRIMTNSHT